MLKSFLVLPAVALFAIAPSTSFFASAQDATTKTKVTADSQNKAKKLYAIDCALCHGATGDGKTDLAKDMQLTMIDWTDPKSLSTMQDQDLFKTIRNGKGKMPAEDSGRAKDDEIWNLVIYIRGLGKAQPATEPAATPASTPAPSSSSTPAPSSN
jgi:mono/diheme cytochrome c family protein